MMWWRRKPPKPPRRSLKARLQRFVPRGAGRPLLKWGGIAAAVALVGWGAVKAWRDGGPLLAGIGGWIGHRAPCRTPEVGLAGPPGLGGGPRRNPHPGLGTAAGGRPRDPHFAL